MTPISITPCSIRENGDCEYFRRDQKDSFAKLQGVSQNKEPGNFHLPREKEVQKLSVSENVNCEEFFNSLHGIKPILLPFAHS